MQSTDGKKLAAALELDALAPLATKAREIAKGLREQARATSPGTRRHYLKEDARRFMDLSAAIAAILEQHDEEAEETGFSWTDTQTKEA